VPNVEAAQVRCLTDDMQRRAEAAPSAASGSASRTRVWSVQWEPTGHYTATADADFIRGWAAHPEVVTDELGNWDTPPSRPEVRWEGRKPLPQNLLCEGHPSNLGDWPHRCGDEQVKRLFYARSERLAEVVAAVEVLRNRWSDTEVPAQIAARAAELQQQEPPLPNIPDELIPNGNAIWATSSTAEWVPTRSIVRGASGEGWGEFDPSEIESRATKLLVAADINLPEYLARYFAGVGGKVLPVPLLRIPGPAGPLYLGNTGGRHRIHQFRILGLPWLFAATTLIPLPRKVKINDVAHDWDVCEETVRLWQGLVDSEVVRGRLNRPSRLLATTLQLDYAPALWLLLPAELATCYNQRYELLHPGALGAAGVPAAALESTDAWRNWLTRH
jgi:hypothetical protein